MIIEMDEGSRIEWNGKGVSEMKWRWKKMVGRGWNEYG
jgi:hypothetical protein